MDKQDTFDMYTERYHDAAASGDLETLESVLKVLPDIDVKNHRGWTALMFAARNGHLNIAETLVHRGCDLGVINSTGQTALNIAAFWNHDAIIKLLSPNTMREGGINFQPEIDNYLCKNPLDRYAHKRKDEEWLDGKLKEDSTKIILLHNLRPVIKRQPDLSLKGHSSKYILLVVKFDDLPTGIEDPGFVFLGIESEEVAWFAADISNIKEDAITDIHPYAEVPHLMTALMAMKNNDGAIFGQARSILAWHDRNKFCPTCGNVSKVSEAGYKRACTNNDCKSLTGVHNTSYPRLDPTVIMVVISPDGKEILLGRGKKFPPQMFSCLAGFIEPGESMEEACRREVKEETGIEVGRVQYHSSQPWPLPASLMLGCIANATSKNIKIDKDELDDARWFSRQEVVQMLTKQHPLHFFCPPEEAIAHHLIRAWVNCASNL